MTAALILKPGREKSLLRRHPWVFSGAVDRLEGSPASGETLAIQDAQGQFLAWAAYSPQSQIMARVWSFDAHETIAPQFFRRRLAQAIAARRAITVAPPAGVKLVEDGISFSHAGKHSFPACRLAHAESDGLPGFILDQYYDTVSRSDTLVAQFLSAGAEYWRATLAAEAMELTGASRLFDRSDVDVRQLEGLDLRVARISGDEPPDEIWIEESGLYLAVDVRRGHKTGFYLDQRRSRERVRALAAGREVLDCFCYTGGFSMNALAGGATSVTAVDASADALRLARRNVEYNKLPLERVEFIEGDVFQTLRKMRDSRRAYDLIILDPPKFAQNAAQVERAARGYKDINLLAFKLLRPGGLLATFSCSGGVGAELFQKIVAGAVLDAGTDAQIIEHFQQAADHPVALHFPEGAYLKGLLLRKVA